MYRVVRFLRMLTRGAGGILLSLLLWSIESSENRHWCQNHVKS